MRIILFMFILVLALQAKPIFSNTDQADSSQYIEALKNLVIATQKTRGLTNSYLNGNLIALMLVQDAKSNMKKAIGSMESLKLASDPVINQRATDMSSKLTDLNRKAFKLKPEESFERYTQEIEQILMLAQTVSKRSADHMSPFAKDASFVMMEQMLPLTEYVGQLRGYGSGIAAKGAITQEQKENLSVIIANLTSLNNELQARIKNVLSSGRKYYPQDVEEKVTKMNSSLEAYVEFAKKEFYKESISINPDSYFTNGTEIITQIIAIYDTTNKAILEDSKGWL
ncbi:MAG: nitrate- and nitrite sensing domain-containing protein [Sulfurimonas sp.]|uniref:nitrate- and nitrite sensing domain-containing protein n=1 Tax=Sulfurimonas sp. TaxID=2022749 RepID=UPI0026261841|nr:nitrate- and nitrite sensing domain-containing protein [Sulfurimonas sp.]MDD2653232.1 nitrate- and nitrite sensing domain-containing protein [Sulfurimonas sp.]MDD3452305.1 nitrate- and nitrite sensing domain-containing protein [Sulfurimonas sp.]